jgi:hypothetical protein
VPPAHSGCEIGVHNTSPPTARKVTATTTLHVGTRAARTVKLNPSKKRKGDEKMGKTVDAGAGHRNRYGPMARRDMHGARVSWFFTAELIEVVDLRVQGGGVRCGMGRSSCRWSPRYRLGYEEGTPPSWRGGGGGARFFPLPRLQEIARERRPTVAASHGLTATPDSNPHFQ